MKKIIAAIMTVAVLMSGMTVEAESYPEWRPDAPVLRDLSSFHRCKVCGAFIKANARQGKCLECRCAENRAIRRARIIANRGGGRGHKKGES